MSLPKRKYHKRGEHVHGFSVVKHPLYYTWYNMLRRCYKETDKSYANYGGRGITVDPRWHEFKNFANDIGLKPDKSYSLERVDNDVGYSKANCKWASRSEQCANRRAFKTSQTGQPGVLPLANGTYLARFDYEYERYHIGRFRSLGAAVDARKAFVWLFKRDRAAAVTLAKRETLSLKSTTKVRGVTPHVDGGFMVRATRGGVRHYLGYFQTIEEAANARREFLAS